MWSLVLGVVLLGPALGPGLVLSYDMVWVPDLAVRPDAWGVGSALPRAVPSDLVVAVADEVLPGMLLQKLVLLGALVGAGAGAAALVTGLPVGARVVAASVAVWNPFVVERLVIGHWPVLVGYAVLPWLVLAAARSRHAARTPARLGPLLVVGSLSASAGVASAVAVLVAGGRAHLVRHLLLVVAANAPWIVAGLLHAGAATSDPAGARAFATAGEGLLPAPLAALSLGGIWNSEVVPHSRTGWLGVISLVLLAVLATAGWRQWWRTATTASWTRMPLIVCWAVGFGLALLSWAAPGVLGALAGQVPGGGLLRDGSRLLGLCVPLVAVLAGHGADIVTRRLPDRVSVTVAAASLAVAPVALMPDAALGVEDRLTASALPSAYLEIGEAVDRLPAGDVVVLPLSTYRAPEWLGGRKVLDPLPRLLARDVVSDDVLYVDGEALSGEDPVAAEVREALALPGPSGRADALGRLGVAGVVIDTSVPGQTPPAIAGELVTQEGGLRVVALAAAVEPRDVPTGWVAATGGAWLGWLWVLVQGPLVGVAAAVGSRRMSGRGRLEP